MPLSARAEHASGQRFEIYILIIHNYIMMLVQFFYKKNNNRRFRFFNFFQFIFTQIVNVTARIHEEHIIIQIHVFINEEIVSEVHVQYKLGKGKKRNKVQIFKEDSLI